MAKTRTTLTVDEEVLRAVKIRAARTGKGESEIIEEALRLERWPSRKSALGLAKTSPTD